MLLLLHVEWIMLLLLHVEWIMLLRLHVEWIMLLRLHVEWTTQLFHTTAQTKMVSYVLCSRFQVCRLSRNQLSTLTKTSQKGILLHT